MKISVITVCLNASSTLRRTIESVLNQTRKVDEYIIVDGGSTDGTLEIIKSYGPAISTWISEKDKGISDAFNKGIALATGDWIGILNADDWYEPTTLQLIEEHGHEVEVLHGIIQYWTKGEKDYRAEGYHDLLKSEMTVHHPTVFVKRSVYNECGVFRLDYRYAMDYELVLRFYLAGKKFGYVPHVLANMSFDGASDRHWKKATRESKEAKIVNGLPQSNARLYYWKQMIRTSVARTLKKSGLSILLNAYRKRFSLVKKTT